MLAPGDESNPFDLAVDFPRIGFRSSHRPGQFPADAILRDTDGASHKLNVLASHFGGHSMPMLTSSLPSTTTLWAEVDVRMVRILMNFVSTTWRPG